MIRTNIEIGILRTYYVLWAIVLLWGIGFGLLSILVYPERIEWAAAAWGAIGIVLLPPAFMFTVRWIYRGFVPKLA